MIIDEFVRWKNHKVYNIFHKDGALKDYGLSKPGQSETMDGDLLHVNVYFKTLNERTVETVAVYDVI